MKSKHFFQNVWQKPTATDASRLSGTVQPERDDVHHVVHRADILDHEMAMECEDGDRSTS